MRIILITFFLSLSFLAKTQFLVHTKGIKGISANFHYTEQGNAFSIDFRKFIEDKSYFRIAGNFETGTIGYAAYEDYLVNGTFGYSPFNVKQKLYFNIEAGVLLGFESRDEMFDYPKQSQFVYGFNGLAEIEYFLSSNFAIGVHFQQHYLFSTILGSLRYQIGGGFKLYF